MAYLGGAKSFCVNLVHEIQGVWYPYVQPAGLLLGCDTFLLFLLFHPTTRRGAVALFVPGIVCMCHMEIAEE